MIWCLGFGLNNPVGVSSYRENTTDSELTAEAGWWGHVGFIVISSFLWMFEICNKKVGFKKLFDSEIVPIH